MEKGHTVVITTKSAVAALSNSKQGKHFKITTMFFYSSQVRDRSIDEKHSQEFQLSIVIFGTYLFKLNHSETK